MKKIFNNLALIVAFSVGLAACGGQAHASVTEDFVVNHTDTRLYSLNTEVVKSIEQTSASVYVISYLDGSAAQTMSDTAGVQFTALKTIPGFADKYIVTKNYSNGDVMYVSKKFTKMLICTGGYLTIVSTTYNDASCTQYNLIYTGAVQ